MIINNNFLNVIISKAPNQKLHINYENEYYFSICIYRSWKIIYKNVKDKLMRNRTLPS